MSSLVFCKARYKISIRKTKNSSLFSPFGVFNCDLLAGQNENCDGILKEDFFVVVLFSLKKKNEWFSRAKKLIRHVDGLQCIHAEIKTSPH